MRQLRNQQIKIEWWCIQYNTLQSQANHLLYINSFNFHNFELDIIISNLGEETDQGYREVKELI